MSDFKSYREESRQEYGVTKKQPVTLNELNTGALLRIADAVEKTTESYDRLKRENIALKNTIEAQRKTIIRQSRRESALRGHLTRLKKKLAQSK